MHAAAFAAAAGACPAATAAGAPPPPWAHTYGLLPASTPAPLADMAAGLLPASTSAPANGELMPAGAFGGGNVTIPLKEALLHAHLDGGLLVAELSPRAAAMGAVNTVAPMPGGRLRGDNTDWLGVLLPLRAALARRACAASEGACAAGEGACAGASTADADAGGATALVVGAGGAAAAAAYALRALGLTPLIAARSPARAAALAARFQGALAIPWSDIAQADPGLRSVPPGLTQADPVVRGCPAPGLGCLQAIIHTLPPGAGWLPPPHLLRGRPVLFDCSLPPGGSSPLLDAAQRAGCELVGGRTMLVLQAAAANAAWRGGAGRLLRGGARGAAAAAAHSGAPEHAAMDEDLDLTSVCVMARVAGV